MTREQAKREIDSLDFYLQNHTDDYGEESHTAMMMAIKALEQQTCEDAVSRNLITQTLNKMDRYVAEELTLCDTDKKFPKNEVFIVDDVYEQIVEQLPSVNPQPKTGHWIDIMVGDMPAQACDQCNTFYPLAYTGGGHKYCPNCGAKMVEPQESEE